jgi:hypothetical protein
MKWDYEGLWQKAKLYMERALDQPREGEMFPFWAILALEFLGRATLAKVHPALLADPREGDNILYACGYGQPKQPHSIPAQTVFRRCEAIVEDFLKKDMEKCIWLAGLRNDELHTGAPAFLDLSTQLWLADFYRISEKLLKFQGSRLEDFLGPQEAKAAREMIAVAEQEIVSRAKEKIGRAKHDFALKESEERAVLIKEGEARVRGDWETTHRKVACPACTTTGLIIGEAVREGEPRLQEGKIIQETVYLPVRFLCFACGLHLEGHAELHTGGLGGQFTGEVELEPGEFHGLSMEDFIDYDAYGND